MKHLKKFNEQNNTQDTKCHDFYQEYKNIVDFNEDDYDQGDEPSKVDQLSEIGDLCNKFNMSKDDIKYVLDNYDCSFDYDKLLQITYYEWVDENVLSDGYYWIKLKDNVGSFSNIGIKRGASPVLKSMFSQHNIDGWIIGHLMLGSIFINGFPYPLEKFEIDSKEIKR